MDRNAVNSVDLRGFWDGIESGLSSGEWFEEMDIDYAQLEVVFPGVVLVTLALSTFYSGTLGRRG